jgi:hypothetical protein
MKMVRESATELVYRQGMSVLLLIWSLGFAGIPLVMLIGLSSDSGITRLSCDRPTQEPSAEFPNPLVDCKARRLTFWGLAPQPTQTVSGVLRANQVSEITPGSGDCASMQDHHLLLTSAEGYQVRAVGDNIYRNCVKGNAARLEILASQVNQFIGSQELTFRTTYDNRLNGFNVFFLALCSPFILIGGIALYGAVRSTTLRVNKPDGILIWRESIVWVVLRQKKIQVNDIEAVDVNPQKGNDNECFYKLSIKPKRGRPIELLCSASQDDVNAMADKILEALTVPNGSAGRTFSDREENF